MSFNDINFIFLFLPVFLLIYYGLPSFCRNTVLLLGSIAFFLVGGFKNPVILILPVAEIILAYLLALGMNAKRRLALPLLIVYLAGAFGVLLGFKYAGLFTGESIVLPAGISFYTFQLTGYMMDVYRQNMPPEKSLLNFSAGMLMFPKLLSGPIVPWKDLKPQLENRTLTAKKFDNGLRTFIIGLALKTLVADRIGGLWSQLGTIGYASISTPLAWLGILAYSLQLFFDFYGYSVMAIGIGRMLGFELPENFLFPYASKSMSDFWRRWHVTLGAWFRDYVYIPLGGSRKGQKALVINLFVVWVMTGVWHGSTLNFLIWSMFIFGLIVAEKLSGGRFPGKNPVLTRIYMIFAIMISWMFFAITDLSDIGVYLGRLFPITGKFAGAFAGDFVFYLKQFGVYIAIGIALCLPWTKKVWLRLRSTPIFTAILFILFWLSIYCVSGGMNDPFMYFSF